MICLQRSSSLVTSKIWNLRTIDYWPTMLMVVMKKYLLNLIEVIKRHLLLFVN